MKKFKFFVLFTAVVLLQHLQLHAQQDITIQAYNNQKELTATRSITLSPGFTAGPGSTLSVYIATDPGPRVDTRINQFMKSIITYTPRVPGLVDASDPNNGAKQVNVEVQTLDQFGNVKEVQQIKQTPGMKDLMQLRAYDVAGRELTKYLPYVSETGSENFGSGGYTTIPTDFNSSLNPANYARVATAASYSQVRLDHSPDNTVVESASPGNDFTIASQHTVRQDVLTAFVALARFKVDAAGALTRESGPAGFYMTSQLAMTRTEDENVPYHDEHDPSTGIYVYKSNGATYEYKNYLGQTVLKQQYRNIGADTGEWLSTWYVYDEQGNLRYVLPPKAEAGTAPGVPTQTVLDELCYQYKYDKQQRLIEKKLPGKGWEFILYNQLNQPVMTQDAVQRGKSPQEWSYIKYDALGRTVSTGIYKHTGSTAATDYYSYFQNLINTWTGTWWEARDSAGSNGYTNTAFPATGTLLSVAYFDDYNIPGLPAAYAAPPEASKITRGLPTASKMAVINPDAGISTDMLWSVSYYDDYGRAIKSYKQHYLGGSLAYAPGNVDEVSSTYNFTGALLTAKRLHKVNGTQQLLVYYEYVYDHAGRKTDSWETINTGTRTLLARNVYDELGYLFKKQLHSTDNGSNFLQTITYRYNERGWLTQAQADKFNLALKYSQPTSGRGGTPQYNGNIAEMEYTGQYSGNKWFLYGYDNYNRLTETYDGNTGPFNEFVQYDKGGNITSLKRGTSGATTTYTYANSGNSNQLLSLAGGLTGGYTYDANGNAKNDTRRGVSIIYNQLNLPATVTGNGNAAYTYDATGSKIKSVQSGTARDYIAGIQYTGGVIESVATEEGRVTWDSATSTWKYEYNLKDHLGNNRVTIRSNAGTAEVIQEDQYFSFGLNVSTYRYGTENKYLYNSKEKQDVLADEYDYGARFYDPVIGRWTSVDPLAEKFASLSAYNFVANNPLTLVDPDGRDIIDSKRGVTFNNNNTKDLTAAYNLITNKRRNVYLDIERRSNIRSQTNELNKGGFYGQWDVLSASNFATGLSALTAIHSVTQSGLDNLVIETHGGVGNESSMKINDLEGTEAKNFVYTHELDIVNGNVYSGDVHDCDYIESKVNQLKNLADLVTDGGRLILAACDIGKGREGLAFGRNVGQLTGNRLNVFMPTGWVDAVVSTDLITGRFTPWIKNSFSVNNNPGWLQVTPQGKTRYIGSININRSGNPIEINK